MLNKDTHYLRVMVFTAIDEKERETKTVKKTRYDTRRGAGRRTLHGAERKVWCEARRNIVFILSHVSKVRTFPIVQRRPLELGVLLSRYCRITLLIKTAVSVITNQLFSIFARSHECLPSVGSNGGHES